jgi:site-specific DNA recombinase
VPELDAAGRKLGHRIEIYEEQARIIRRIFIEYLKGGSLSGIAYTLNEEGIPSPRAGTRHKRQGWGSSTIRAMLYNEKYAGVWRFKEREWVKIPGTNRRVPRARDASDVMCTERPELRIIDADLWDEVQIRLKAIKRKYTKTSRERVIAGNKSNYLLSGILVCGVCGAPMTIHGGAEIKYYRCADNRTKGTCDNGRSIREDVIRSRILQGIRERLMSDQGLDYVRKRVATELRDFSRRVEEELNQCKTRLARTEEQIQSLIRFIAQGERSDYVSTALRDLEGQARADKIELARLTQQAQTPLRLPSIQEVTALVFDLDSRLAEDPEAGRQLLRRWFQDQQIQIIPQGDGTCLAQGALLPLVILDAANNTAAKAPKKAKGPAEFRETLWSNICSGDRI